MLLSNRRESTEEQPFFKVSSQNKPTSHQPGFFLLSNQTAKESSKSSPPSIFQDPTPTPKHHGQFQLPSSIMSTQSGYQGGQTKHHQRVQTPGPQGVTQKEPLTTHSSEKLTSLHSRLHQEAEKIRRWKVSTEIELKEQEQRLRGSLQTIESQRKSLLELQLQNETLSGKLKEEIDGRAEMEEKIEATRDLCSVVKDFSVKLEEKLVMTEQDRDDIQETQKRYQEDFLVLQEKFQELSLVHVTKLDELQNQIADEKSRSSQLETGYQERFAALDKEVNQLKEDCNSKEQNLARLSQELTAKADALNATTNEKESIQAFLQKSEASLMQYKEHVEKLSQELTEVQNNLDQSKNEKAGLQETLEKSEKDQQKLSDVISEQGEELKALSEAKDKVTHEQQMLKEQYTLKESCEKDQQMLSEVISKQGEEQKALSKAKDKVTQEQHMLKEQYTQKENEIGALQEAVAQVQETSQKHSEEQQGKISTLENEKQQLQTDMESLNQKMKVVLEEKEGLLTSIEERMQLLQKKEADIATLKDELKDVLVREKASYDKLDLLKRDIEDARLQNGNLMKTVEGMESEKMALLEQQKVADGKADELTNELEKTLEDLTSHREQLESLMAVKGELEQKIGRLSSEREEQDVTNQRQQTEEQQQMKKLTEQIEDLEGKVSKMDAENKKLQTQVTQKTKQIKEQQQETKTARSKNNQQTKQFTKLQKEIDQLNAKITKEQEACMQAKEKLEETEVTIKTKEHEIAVLGEKLTEIQSASEKSVKEHDLAKEACEQQMREVGATLDKYKAENQKIVAQKDKEIEKLQAKLAKESTAKKTEDKNLQKQHEGEMKKLKELIEEITKEKDTFEGERKLLQSEIDEIKRDMEEKDKMVTSQEKELEDLKAKLTAAQEESLKVVAAIPEAPESISHPSKENGKTGVPATPRTPLTVRMATPKQKTPSHGILKTGDSISAKKRSRVMFAPEDKPSTPHDSGTDSDSSTSQLMEIELDNVPFPPRKEKSKKKTKPQQTVTPIRVRPSPKAKPDTPQLEDMSPFTGQSVTSKKTLSRSKQSEDPLPSANTRKTPKKAFRVKSWGDSPYRKKKKPSPAKPKKQEPLWLENDTVFGFFDD